MDMINARKQTKALPLAVALELHPLRFELQIWLSWLPCRHPNKTGHSDQDILTGLFIFLVKKNQNLFDIQEQCICKLGKIQSELKLLCGVYYFMWCLLLIFKVVYRDHLTQLLPITWDIVEKGQRLV